MRFLLLFCIGGLLLALCSGTSLPAQRSGESAPPDGISVPFIGCKSDGQAGPIDAPTGKGRFVPISKRAAQKLAYYKSERSPGVLAPRGWYCFGTYDSSGNGLIVSPRPIEAESVFNGRWSGFEGPIVEIHDMNSGASGRYLIAEVIARVFPAYKTFVADLTDFKVEFGPFPEDRLSYKSKTVVEYETPALTKGLGTNFCCLKQNDTAIRGVAILIGNKASELLMLKVRLPSGQTGLTSAIIHQTEFDAARISSH